MLTGGAGIRGRRLTLPIIILLGGLPALTALPSLECSPLVLAAALWAFAPDHLPAPSRPSCSGA